jgi:hypothetical protein
VPRVTVLVLHPDPPSDAGPLTCGLATARRAIGDRHVRGFLEAGADDARLVAGRPDDTPFGARLRELARPIGRDGLVVLGSGAMALARPRDRRAFVEVAASGERIALANNRYSADAVAVGRADVLADVPDLPVDNALPRWLDEVAGVPVRDLRRRDRLGLDLDSPLDVLVATRATRAKGAAGDLWTVAAILPDAVVAPRLDAVATLLADRRAEVLVAGRTASATLRWLEGHAACRVRALVEERGLRASSPLSMAAGTGRSRPRRPSSVLGMVLDREGPDALGSVVGRLADAAIVDTRVLLAHRLGADERRWPSPEDRFASDLLLPERIADPWLHHLTASAADGPTPVLLGGHTLVGPALTLLTGRSRQPWT